MKMGQHREAGDCRPLTGGVTLRSKGTLSFARMKMTPNSVFSFFVGDKMGAFRKPHRFDELDNVRYYEICSNQVEVIYVYESDH